MMGKFMLHLNTLNIIPMQAREAGAVQRRAVVVPNSDVAEWFNHILLPYSNPQRVMESETLLL